MRLKAGRKISDPPSENIMYSLIFLEKYSKIAKKCRNLVFSANFTPIFGHCLPIKHLKKTPKNRRKMQKSSIFGKIRYHPAKFKFSDQNRANFIKKHIFPRAKPKNT